MVRLTFWMVMVVVSSACAPDTAMDGTNDDSELAAIVAAGQADREAPIDDTDWAAVAARDALRRARVLELIESGRLTTGRDLARAALVFQHGETAEDILLAHVLAVTAVAEGHSDSRRMTALTLDRYLTWIDRPQVFGTNFRISDLSRPEAWSLEPYDEALVADALRARHCVASRAATRALLARMQAGDLTEPAPVCGTE